MTSTFRGWTLKCVFNFIFNSSFDSRKKKRSPQLLMQFSCGWVYTERSSWTESEALLLLHWIWHSTSMFSLLRNLTMAQIKEAQTAASLAHMLFPNGKQEASFSTDCSSVCQPVHCCLMGSFTVFLLNSTLHLGFHIVVSAILAVIPEVFLRLFYSFKKQELLLYLALAFLQCVAIISKVSRFIPPLPKKE